MASRRIELVWSAEYSPVARPSRLRAAPAKKATLSTVPGTSNSRASLIGLPAWRLSASANSSARAANATEMRARISARSPGVVPDQPPKARRAACTAASTSLWEASWIASYASPQEGSTRSIVVDEVPRRRSPSMNWYIGSLSGCRGCAVEPTGQCTRSAKSCTACPAHATSFGTVEPLTPRPPTISPPASIGTPPPKTT